MYNISLLHPYVFFILIIYFIIILLFKQKDSSIYFSNTQKIEKKIWNLDYISTLLKFLAIFSMLIALSSPISKTNINTSYTKGYQIGLLVDASLSMGNHNKFKITKKILKQFIKKRTYDSLSLVVFGDNQRVASPLTYNKTTLLKVLKSLTIGIAGDMQTSIYQTIFLAINLFKNVTTDNKIMILLTDGRNSTGKIPLRVAIQKANMHHIRIYTIGIGDKNDFNADILRRIAIKTKGKFYEADNEKKLLQIYNNIDSLTKDKIQMDKYTQINYLFEYPLIVSLLSVFILLLLQRRYNVF